MKYIPLLAAVVLALTLPALPIQPAEPCEALSPDMKLVEITTLAELPEPTEPVTYYVIDRTEPPESEPCYPLRGWERKLIERVLMSECPYEPIEGQRAVAQVILDRIHSKAYPDNVYDVLTQDGQFAGPSTEEVNEEVTEAVAAVFDRGERISNAELLYFYAPKYGTSTWHERQTFVTKIGGHKFYN